MTTFLKPDQPAAETAAQPLGAAVAAIVASGIGILTIGLLTTGAAANANLKAFLNWYEPTGSLSGKLGLGTLIWLISWFLLHNAWKDKEMRLDPALATTLILIALGLLFTFPPVFEAFGG